MRPRVKPHWASDIKRVGAFRCQLEADVAASLKELGHEYGYEATKLDYVTHHKYIADFTIGDVLIEVKGFWPAEQRAKIRLLIKCNPGIKLFVALRNPNTKVNKNSRLTYADWCRRYSIPWCPIPIEKEFLEAWLKGERVTY